MTGRHSRPVYVLDEVDGIDPGTATAVRNMTDAELRRMLDTTPASGVGSPLHRALVAEAERRDMPSTSTCPLHGAECEAWS